MWGGRFAQSPAEIMQEINASIDVDKRLYQQDIAGSKAHAQMLAEQGIISKEDEKAILAGLDEILQEIKEGCFNFQSALEDIHMNIESSLRQKIGDAAARLHTGRSRNDQVATDFKLWTRLQYQIVISTLESLIEQLALKAAYYADTILPGFTHLQPAQPVTFGHHLLAYAEMLRRDRARFKDAFRRSEDCPLGAAALAGTGFPINRYMTAEALGFARPSRNSIDAVSDRDFALDFLSVASIAMLHLSRMAEEMVIWASPSFGFIRLSDRFSTGSSIMPQKRNPDAAELVRAKSGRVLGAFTTLATVMKGLPLAYSKDMQEDKEVTFWAADALSLSLAAMYGMIEDLKADPKAMLAACKVGHLSATDLADWLVRRFSMPFRDAHHVTGAIVKRADALGLALWDLPLGEMQKVEPRINEEVYSVLSIESSVASRTSLGGTAPGRVREAAKEVLEAVKSWKK